MQIYKSTQLYNRYVQERASDALEDHLISNASFQKIKEAHPDTLYTPNFFIRIALALLTAVAVLFSAGIFGLMFFSSDSSVVLSLIFLAFICYAALELFVQKKWFYNAGVDNAFMVAILVFILGACLITSFSVDTRVLSAVMILMCGWLYLRFTDAFMALLCYLSLFVFLFTNFIEFGSLAKMVSPLVMMAFSAVAYIVFQRLRTTRNFRSYHHCHTVITLCALLSFYLSGNYFVVNELSIELFGRPITTSRVTAGMLWCFTVAIPLLYVAFGVVRKDKLLIRTGLVLIAAAVFTLRYYYAVFPLEITMFIAGMLLISISYALIRYLRTPKHGFAFKIQNADAILIEQAQSLITADRFGTTTPVETGFEFGGGSGGGAGASGKF
jgi:hypothetical protein